MLQRVIDEFKRFCKRIGGDVEVNEYLKSASCILEPYDYYDYTRSAEYAHEFAEFIEKWRPELKENAIDLSIDVVEKLIGGYAESAGIVYDSYDDMYRLYANIYSEYSMEYGRERKGVEPPEIKKEVLGVPIKGKGDVEWNRDTWVWMGVGYVETRIKDLRRISEDDIEKIMNAMVDEAEDLANEALETLIEPEEEEEEEW